MTPGRMAPIYQIGKWLERQRAADPCRAVDVFVHDFNRDVERTWSFLFLAPHARLLNFEGIARWQGASTARSNSSSFLAWFRTP